MKAEQPKPADELRMSGKEFDRIMGHALRVKPEDAKKLKRATKTKTARKKRAARK
ncbi:MAG: hypothetical protein ACREC0_10225 [Methylocella sp.]